MKKQFINNIVEIEMDLYNTFKDNEAIKSLYNEMDDY